MRSHRSRPPIRSLAAPSSAEPRRRLNVAITTALAIALTGCGAPNAVEPTPPDDWSHRGASPERATPQRLVYSPYKHVPIALGADDVISLAVPGGPVPVAANGRSTLPPGVNTLTLAFATGECGSETWDGLEPSRITSGNVRAFDQAGIDFIVSTGGEAGSFTCTTDAGMEAFVAHYASARLIGFDFDIERGQSADVVASLVQRIKAAKARHPELRISFTLATWAASDGSLASLNDDGQRVMQAIRDAGLQDFYVNLMVMDYGEAIPRNCVVSAGVCDMGRSAIQAARNVHVRYGLPMSRIELTPMIGVNDVVSNVFTLDDARLLAGFVRDCGLGGVHFWSLDRDAPCEPGVAAVSSVCSGLTSLPVFAYTRAFRGLR
jgi:chitinase